MEDHLGEPHQFRIVRSENPAGQTLTRDTRYLHAIWELNYALPVRTAGGRVERMKAKIFVSYRRQDSAADTRSIYQTLAARFGRANVFLDIDTIAKGENFRTALQEHLAQCAVLVAIVGQQWFIRDAQGPGVVTEFVRLEISGALARNVPVIPVLVQGASSPPRALLPEELKELADLQAVTISHENYAADVSVLLRSIAGHINRQLTPLERMIRIPGGLLSKASIAAAVLAGGAAAWFTLSNVSHPAGMESFGKTDYGIVVAEIAENAGTTAGEDRTVSQVLIDSMSDLLNATPGPGGKSVVIRALGEPVPVAKGHEAALAIARRYNASLIVWGWYSKDSQSSLIRLNADLGAPELLKAPYVENLDDPRVTPANYVGMFGTVVHEPRPDQIFNLEFTVSSSREASASAALIVGFIAYARGEFDKAAPLLAALTERNKQVPPLVQAYAHFLLGDIQLIRSRAERDADHQENDALSSFIAASECLGEDTGYARTLRAKIQNNIGAILMSKGDYTGADAFISRSLELSADNATAYANKGRVLLNRAGLGDSDRSSYYFFLTGDAEQANRRKAESDGIASMKKALSLNPRLLMPRIWLAKVAIARNDVKEAREQLQSVFDAFQKLDRQHVSLPDQAVIAFVQEFGPEFTTDLVQPENRTRVIAQLSSYLKTQERLFKMFSTMNPRAMGLAGHNAEQARTAIARLRNEIPAPAAEEPPESGADAAPAVAQEFENSVQQAISSSRRQDAIEQLRTSVEKYGDRGARYVLGKLLFESGDRRGAFEALASAVREEIASMNYGFGQWNVRFSDGERRCTYRDYVDILMQSVASQAQYDLAIGMLLQRAHLFDVDQLSALLTPGYTPTPPQRREILENLGGALARSGQYAQAADRFAEARHDGGPRSESTLDLTLSELKMRASGSEPLGVLTALLAEAQAEFNDMRAQLPPYRADYLAEKLDLWNCELSLKGSGDPDASCRDRIGLPDAKRNNLLRAYYEGRFALRRGEVAEWLHTTELAVKAHMAYFHGTSFNEVDTVPRDETQVFDSMLRDLTTYYRKSKDYGKIGGLLFYTFDSGHVVYEERRLQALQTDLMR